MEKGEFPLGDDGEFGNIDLDTLGIRANCPRQLSTHTQEREHGKLSIAVDGLNCVDSIAKGWFHFEQNLSKRQSVLLISFTSCLVPDGLCCLIVAILTCNF